MEQMKVIIVEDEPIVARYIKGILESLDGFSVVAVCESGEDAVEQCKEKKPYLVITDIKMPGITGLELIKRIKKLEADIQTIIISGFKSFDYAKEAIALGVEDYITKPINPEELKCTLQRILENYHRRYLLENVFKIERSMRSMDEEEFKEQFPYESCSLLMVYQSGDAEDMEYLIKNDNGLLSFFYRKVLVVLDANCQNTSSDYLKKIMKQIIFSKQRKKTCTVMMIREMDLSKDCIREIQRLHRILREQTVLGKLICVEYESAKTIKRQTEFFDDKILNKLEIKITAQKWNAVSECLQELFEFWKKNYYTLYHIKVVIHQITDKIQRAGAIVQDKVFVNEYIDDCIKYADSYDEMKDAVCNYLEEIIKTSSSSKKEGSKSQQLFEQICDFVYKNMDKSYSLSEISNIFGASQPFIRKIFRTNVDKSYNEWVIDVKMERAKELLSENPMLQIKEVAEKLGYEQLYFSTVFNKNVGMSPSEYKFRNLESETMELTI